MRLLLPRGAKSHHETPARTRSPRSVRWLAFFLGPALTAPGRRAALFVGALMLGTLCLGDRGLIKLIGLLRGRAAVRAELVELERHRIDLEAQLRLFTTDSATIEKTARESLDWVRHGEIVYKFPAK